MRSICLLAFLPAVLAIFADEAYHIDFHYTLLGLPQSATTFFHQPYPGSKASLIYTLSEKSVLGAVNPKDGSVVWRQSLPTANTPGILKFGEDQDTLISASGNVVNGWSSADGKFAWSYDLGGNQVVDLGILDSVHAEAGIAKDAVVLVAGANPMVQRLDSKTGDVKWTYKDSSDDIPYRVSTSASSFYVVSYHKDFTNGLKLKVTSINPSTGRKLEEYVLSSNNDAASPSDIVYVGSNLGSSIVAWTSQAKRVLTVNILGSNKVHSFDIESKGKEITNVTIHAANKNDASPHFLVHYETIDSHWAEVFHIDRQSSSISKAYDLPNLAGHGVFSASAIDAHVYFTRITEEEVILVASVSHGILERWTIEDLRVPGVTARPFPVHATSEVVARTGSSFAIRSAVLLSNGDWILVRNGEKSWSRHEALAGAVKAAWVTTTQQPQLVEELETEAHQGAFAAFVHRMRRHTHDLQTLPNLLKSLTQLGSKKMPGTSGTVDDSQAQNENFGFNKLVIAATESGRLIALEAGKQGRIAWNIKGKNLLPGQKWDVSSASSVINELLSSGGPLLDVGSGQSPDLLSWEKQVSEVSSVSHEKVPVKAITYSIKDGSLSGYQKQKQLWHFTPKSGQTIISVKSMQDNEPVASIGKVLGDRRVLYKYLNPNAILLLAANHARRELSAYLIDSVSGTVLHTVVNSNVDTSRPIASVISENWFSYSFSLDGADDSTSKGYQLVIAEFLESDIPNDRGTLSAAANSSSIDPIALTSRPVVLSQVFHIPEEISSMAVTQTAQGITSRELLVSLSGSNSIVGIPRYVVDPRRVVGKDPTNPQREEGLSRYAPMIEFDPKWYLNHKEEILGVKDIIATPANLESTSLIFAYGHDLFGTRVSPSFAFDVLGNSFNKIQLILTVVALTVAVFFVAPLIARKQTNALWQNMS